MWIPPTPDFEREWHFENLGIARTEVFTAVWISPPSGGESGTHSPRPRKNARAAAVSTLNPARRIRPMDNPLGR
jgi:hypothetical protein